MAGSSPVGSPTRALDEVRGFETDAQLASAIVEELSDSIRQQDSAVQTGVLLHNSSVLSELQYSLSTSLKLWLPTLAHDELHVSKLMEYFNLTLKEDGPESPSTALNAANQGPFRRTVERQKEVALRRQTLERAYITAVTLGECFEMWLRHGDFRASEKIHWCEPAFSVIIWYVLMLFCQAPEHLQTGYG